jgi:hypothetical protein
LQALGPVKRHVGQVILAICCPSLRIISRMENKNMFTCIDRSLDLNIWVHKSGIC